MAEPWRGRGLEWGHEEERECRRESPWHAWTTLTVALAAGRKDVLAVCAGCHVRRCMADHQAHGGRCTLATNHPPGVPHRFPDLWSEPVGGKLAVPRRKSKRDG